MGEIAGQPENSPSGFLRLYPEPSVSPILIWLGLQPLPVKQSQSPLTVQEVEARVKALVAGEAMPVTPTLVLLGVLTTQTTLRLRHQGDLLGYLTGEGQSLRDSCILVLG